MSCLRLTPGAIINSQWRTGHVPESTRDLLVMGTAVNLDVSASMYGHGIGTIEDNESKLIVQDAHEFIVYLGLCWAVLTCPMVMCCDELTLWSVFIALKCQVGN